MSRLLVPRRSRLRPASTILQVIPVEHFKSFPVVSETRLIAASCRFARLSPGCRIGLDEELGSSDDATDWRDNGFVDGSFPSSSRQEPVSQDTGTVSVFSSGGVNISHRYSQVFFSTKTSSVSFTVIIGCKRKSKAHREPRARAADACARGDRDVKPGNDETIKNVK